ncbi:TadE/TadG family type IV pilus assembly protein [Halomonas heilongjiangensis]|uniref:Pilus assembly protein n=1 Tax=Halomonas heilongjiangensis TaxID=1387883 RepID=A0A2N7TPS3_9GAMM|nr:TadE/TadG family type IV pilus assembly protein [Halomonas heilongjiangensis]PMR70187.1 pilus assembly protein [Halomonas heilongjiangensis]PXX87539.1 pilus assembly protein [Halomonas heilongjiangensis]
MTGRKRQRASLRRQQGSETVEFAISATLLFILLFGIIEFSVALFDKATLTNASREGARTGILFKQSPRDLVAEDAAIEQAIRDYAEQYLISLGGPAEMDISITRSDPNMLPGSDVVVTVDYPYQFLVLPGFIGTLGGILELSATTTMRAE